MGMLRKIRTLWTAGRGIAGGMPDSMPEGDPFDAFRIWYRDAEASSLFLPEAMTLATANASGRPSARMVLLKDVDERGFVFFTNYESRKAQELEANPQAALLFHWAILQRQVRVEGKVERVTREESLTYFQTRPRGSRIGAWASMQSRPLVAREEFEKRIRDMESEFPGDDIPLPDFWGGYRVLPEHIEFWQGRPFRLHDRVVFERVEGTWASHRLYP